MSHGFPAGTLLGARISFPADWPDEPMPADDIAPMPATDWPATPYVPRHAAPALVTCTAGAHPWAPHTQTPACLDAAPSWPLVMCWEASHPFAAHVERDNCDAPYPVES
jgi:hypothetical protein